MDRQALDYGTPTRPAKSNWIVPVIVLAGFAAVGTTFVALMMYYLNAGAGDPPP